MEELRILKDTDLYPIGKIYKGIKMANVPDDYFRWFWGENKGVWKDSPFRLSGSVRRIMTGYGEF